MVPSMTFHDITFPYMGFNELPSKLLEPNCQSYSSVPRLSLAKIFFLAKNFEGDYDLSKHLPVFLLGAENVVGGGGGGWQYW